MKTKLVSITEDEAKALSSAAHWLKRLLDRDDGEGDAHVSLRQDHGALVALLRKVLDT